MLGELHAGAVRHAWAFDGTTWTPLPDVPSGAWSVEDATAATDDVRGRVVVGILDKLDGPAGKRRR